ncbi:MAG: hypothetical protein CMN78_06535 [Spirochaetales bacterium]|nr:hypothetical protein [Spirochaetales bacterium]
MQMSYVVRGIPIGLRLLLYGTLSLAAVVLQVFLTSNIPGYAILAGAGVLLLAKGYKNKPEDLGYEEWKPVSFAEYQKVRANLQSSRKVRISLYFKPTAKAVVIILGVVLLILSLFLSAIANSVRPSVAIVDMLLIAIPLGFSGQIKLWVPRELALKIDAFYPLSSDSKTGNATELVITPYLRFDRDAQGREIPEDIRFMVELKRNPDDFVGIQLQVAVNNGPNGAVPYMYAVYLCRGKSHTYINLANRDYDPYVKETGGDDDYGTVVIRQRTSGGGYYTSPSQCRELYDRVVGALSAL